MAAIEYFKPASLAEAVELKEKYGEAARVFAGGTDIIVNLRDRVLNCKYLLDIKQIAEMQVLEYTPEGGLVIGGAVTINQLLAAAPVIDHYPILVQAGKTLANTLVRNRATLIGNLCNASPAADMAPAALVLGARIIAVSRRGVRQIPLAEFFVGVKRNALRPDELVVKLEIPAIRGKGVYLKRARIKGHDLAQVGVAGFLTGDGHLRLALGAMAATPLLVQGLETLEGDDLQHEEKIATIINKVKEQVNPISDQRSSREYRLAMADYLVRQVLGILGKEVKRA
ncbi:FAD binding domain-containing protein [Moorella sp. ACPs]|uniref:FAD binding domain-containing protein n=1 Tax=Neomoorella carbonis TaxID=3062783 RepID=UPI0032464084